MSRSMGHPDYVYRPLSEETKARMRAAARARRGTPPDCRVVYGEIFPDRSALRLMRLLGRIAQKFGNDAARAAATDIKQNGIRALLKYMRKAPGRTVIRIRQRKERREIEALKDRVSALKRQLKERQGRPLKVPRGTF